MFGHQENPKIDMPYAKPKIKEPPSISKRPVAMAKHTNTRIVKSMTIGPVLPDNPADILPYLYSFTAMTPQNVRLANEQASQQIQSNGEM